MRSTWGTHQPPNYDSEYVIIIVIIFILIITVMIIAVVWQ